MEFSQTEVTEVERLRLWTTKSAVTRRHETAEQAQHVRRDKKREIKRKRVAKLRFVVHG